jgi:hypothetical protein
MRLCLKKQSQALVAHICNTSYSGGRDQENRDWKLTWTNSSRDPISKIPNAKRADRVAQELERLPGKGEVWNSNLSTASLPHKKKKKKAASSCLA